MTTNDKNNEMIVQEPVKATISFSLDHYAYTDAIFLAERLYSEVNSEASLHLLASCYLRAGKPMAAYCVLNKNGCKSSQCRFLLARVCFEMKKFAEAEEALLSIVDPVDPDKVFDLTTTDFTLCHGSNLLVSLWNSAKSAETGLSSVTRTIGPLNAKESSEVVQKAFEIHSPFAVIKSATHTGTIDVFTPESGGSWVPRVSSFAPQKPNVKQNKKSCLTAQNVLDSVVDTSRSSFGVFPLDQHNIISSMSTTSDTDEKKQTENVVKNIPRLDNTRRRVTRSVRHPTSTTTSRTSKIFSSVNQDQESNPPRRSYRLLNSLSSVKENSKNTSRNQENTKTTSVNNRTPPPQKKQKRTTSAAATTASMMVDQKNDDDDTFKVSEDEKQSIKCDNLREAGLKMQRASAEGLMDLLRVMGKAHRYLGNYKLSEAIDVLKNLPVKHRSCGWVLSSLGRCYFELGQYVEAVKYFEESREKEHHRLQGAEYHSTALWHLQQEVKLSMLSQDLVEIDREAPQTWCAAGNCFSLQREHETAIKFLQRAIQVDPDFAYAYTLLGHELVLTEEMDHAMACFRSAIRVDPRHYNAWYGIGMIYYKQEKYDLAEVHYRRAVDICPSSPNLRCHLGIVLHALKKTDAALTVLDEAIRMNPTNALSRFHRASFYFSMERHEEALKELEELKVLIPKESLVYFLIGKVHKRLGNTHLALMNFSWAMSIDPKGASNQIKEVIDRQYSKDDDEDLVIGADSGDESSRRDSHSHHESMDADDEQIGNEGSFEVTF